MAKQQKVNDNRVRYVLQLIGAHSTLALYAFAGSAFIFSTT